MKLSPQKQYLYDILKDGGWVCSNTIDPRTVRDYRKRLSEMNREGFVIKSETCGEWAHQHKAGVHKYMLVEAPKRPLYEYELINGVRVPKLTYRAL